MADTSSVAVRCLQRVSQQPPSAVSASAVADLDAAAGCLLALVLEKCAHGQKDQAQYLPPDLVPAFVKAATQLNTHLVQLQQQQQQQPSRGVVALASALLHLWNCMGNPVRDDWVLHVLPAMAPAVDLALHVLAGTSGGIAPDLHNSQHSLARQHAAVSVALLGSCMCGWDSLIEAEAVRRAGPGSTKRPASREEGVMVSDALQRAVILHCAVFVWAKRQQQQQHTDASHRRSSSSSSWAPAEAKQLLELLGFPLDAVEHYTNCVCKAMPPKNDPLLHHMQQGFIGVQNAINIRLIGLRQRDWTTRYRGFLAAAAPPASPGPDFYRGVNAIQHIMGPGLCPGQLVYLAIEFVAVLGLRQNYLVSGVEGLAFMKLMLMFTAGQEENRVAVQDLSLRQSYAEDCLQYVWSHLGKELQRAAGVAQAELEGNGSQPAAAAAAAAAGSRCDTILRREGVEVDLPADAAARMRLMWYEYDSGLFYVTRLYRQVLHKLPIELYMRQPMRASRVVEAAIRASDPARIKHSDDVVHLLMNVFWAQETTSPEGVAPSTDLLQNKRLAVRSCSQLVSALKLVSQPLAPQMIRPESAVIEWQLRLASYAAMVSVTVHSWATGDLIVDPERMAAMRVVQPNRVQSPGRIGIGLLPLGTEATTVSAKEALATPCYSAWLAATGRALLTVGRLFGVGQGWLQYSMQQSMRGDCPTGIIVVLSLHASAFAWLSEQLTLLAQHPTAAPAAALPPDMLQHLHQLSESLGPRFKGLMDLCDEAPLEAGANPAREAAVFRAFLQASAEGWLHEGLQQLGVQVWAAWPQKYACNDDLCFNLSCLTENSCGRLQCSGCKVAHYCCKEHQKRHWKQHKAVCKHLQQLAQAAAPSS